MRRGPARPDSGPGARCGPGSESVSGPGRTHTAMSGAGPADVSWPEHTPSRALSGAEWRPLRVGEKKTALKLTREKWLCSRNVLRITLATAIWVIILAWPRHKRDSNDFKQSRTRLH